MNYYFDVIQNGDESKELSYNDDDLDFHGERYFAKLIKEHGIQEAIHCVSGGFWEEAELNAGSILLGHYNPYFVELLRNDAEVIGHTENAIREAWEGM